jgi:hypothetical protein
MRAMKRIADTGRTVCATIHQPSSAVFEMFDDLLLLQRGGNVVFFGELGVGSEKLIRYFETNGAPEIEFGENPAAWMFRAFASAQEVNEMDWSETYKMSEQAKSLQEILDKTAANRKDTEKIFYDKVFVTSFQERLHLMNKRILTIYKRSPAYNLTRLVIAIFYSFLIGSVFLRDSGNREVEGWTESDVNGVLGLIFLSTIIIGVTSISMAVPVMVSVPLEQGSNNSCQNLTQFVSSCKRKKFETSSTSIGLLEWLSIILFQFLWLLVRLHIYF